MGPYGLASAGCGGMEGGLFVCFLWIGVVGIGIFLLNLWWIFALFDFFVFLFIFFRILGYFGLRFFIVGKFNDLPL